MENLSVVHISELQNLHPRPEYIFAQGWFEARLAKKFAPESKFIFPIGTETEYAYDLFMNHLPDLFELYNSLVDEESKKTFCGYLLSKVSNQMNHCFYSNNRQYILNGFVPDEGAILIDCGVCDGGTAKRFSEMGYKVYGFEMDKENFKLAKKMADENNFVVENLGLGSYNHEMNYTHFEGNIGGSRLDSSGTETTKVITLDSYVGEKKIPRVDFIKMDVEGAELDVLRGASTVISRWKPILSLSAYHKLDDFWTLYNFIKSLRPDYEFAMRHYGHSREDVPFLFGDGDIENILASLGMEPEIRSTDECVLFAR